MSWFQFPRRCPTYMSKPCNALLPYREVWTHQMRPVLYNMKSVLVYAAGHWGPYMGPNVLHHI